MSVSVPSRVLTTDRTVRPPKRRTPARIAVQTREPSPLDALLAEHLPDVPINPLSQTEIPKLAKDRRAVRAVRKAIKKVPTQHRLYLADARSMAQIPDESVHLAVCSPPYWTLKTYPMNKAQLGMVSDYDVFLAYLD